MRLDLEVMGLKRKMFRDQRSEGLGFQEAWELESQEVRR